MQVLSRKGSLVILRDKKGKLWLTRRQKRKHDNRRRKSIKHSVLHLPIHRIMEEGDWLFTCSLLPVRFGQWLPKNPKDYNKSEFTKTSWEKFMTDDFTTMEGGHHSKQHCGLKPISDEYAEFFNKHNLSDLFHLNDNDFNKYEQAVKEVCNAFKIKFEGI